MTGSATGSRLDHHIRLLRLALPLNAAETLVPPVLQTLPIHSLTSILYHR